MILLDATTHTLELITGGAVSTDYVVTYVDHTTSAFAPASAQGNVSTAATTVIVTAPAASTQRQIKLITVRNRGTSSQTVTIAKDVSGTEYRLTPEVVLQPGESLLYDDDGFQTFDSSGRIKSATAEVTSAGGFTTDFFKVGTASEAAGQYYCCSKDTGGPSAWAPGTPGVNGRNTDGTTSTDAGALLIPNPASGNNYITGANFFASVACSPQIFDVLWVNTGLVVTTTTAQTFTTPTFPARDANGSTNGAGLRVGILVTTATTNASPVTNTTLSYTNQDGTSGRTATMASFPDTAVVGTVVWFQLQAGDTGVRSIQSVTLGTSYAAGAISLIVARQLVSATVPVANLGANAPIDPRAGVKLYNGTCALLFAYTSATTATNLAGTVNVSVR